MVVVIAMKQLMKLLMTMRSGDDAVNLIIKKCSVGRSGDLSLMPFLQFYIYNQ